MRPIAIMIAATAFAAGCKTTSDQAALRSQEPAAAEAPQAPGATATTTFQDVTTAQPGMERLGCTCARASDASADAWELGAYYAEGSKGYRIRLAAAQPLTACIAAKATHQEDCQ